MGRLVRVCEASLEQSTVLYKWTSSLLVSTKCSVERVEFYFDWLLDAFRIY